LSHELLEMLADPWINWCATGNDSKIYALEVCDAVEADDLGYDIDGVRVSDFVTPAWFEPHVRGPVGFQEARLQGAGIGGAGIGARRIHFDLGSGKRLDSNHRQGRRRSTNCARQPPPKEKTDSSGVEEERSLAAA